MGTTIYVRDIVTGLTYIALGGILLFLASTISLPNISVVLSFSGSFLMFGGFIYFLYKFFKTDKEEKPSNPHGTLPKGFGNDSTRNDET